eukprot:CAMPEP_0176230172 /NCGR_PEP_ID=MMETSP0121_2-20121125/24160_1 /TAXON_ID=160619 /ORGANISM="Kryptoperidinium foliaceum, Strain CCMP 1326" /LENGTH=47 /DNA_ID= /DNA_START= /DNA_END= /DNA_ORIENTATION=
MKSISASLALMSAALVAGRYPVYSPGAGGSVETCDGIACKPIDCKPP